MEFEYISYLKLFQGRVDTGKKHDLEVQHLLRVLGGPETARSTPAGFMSAASVIAEPKAEENESPIGHSVSVATGVSKLLSSLLSGLRAEL